MDRVNLNVELLKSIVLHLLSHNPAVGLLCIYTTSKVHQSYTGSAQKQGGLITECTDTHLNEQPTK